MPISASFEARLLPSLPAIIKNFGTPFHIYDEAGIIATGERMKQAFADIDFREYFAVKALPNPTILALMGQLGFGFDCSSLPEIALARAAGATGHDIMFTSNNTSRTELRAATETGSILNLDDLSLIDKVKDFPELISFRYNPGKEQRGCDLIGKPLEAKFGLRDDQVGRSLSPCTGPGGQTFWFAHDDLFERIELPADGKYRPTPFRSCSTSARGAWHRFRVHQSGRRHRYPLQTGRGAI